MIAQNSSATNEHPTPEIVVEPARRLLGGFDIDPASTTSSSPSPGPHDLATMTRKASRNFS